LSSFCYNKRVWFPQVLMFSERSFFVVCLFRLFLRMLELSPCLIDFCFCPSGKTFLTGNLQLFPFPHACAHLFLSIPILPGPHYLPYSHSRDLFGLFPTRIYKRPRLVLRYTSFLPVVPAFHAAKIFLLMLPPQPFMFHFVRRRGFLFFFFFFIRTSLDSVEWSAFFTRPLHCTFLLFFHSAGSIFSQASIGLSVSSAIPTFFV